MLLVSQEHTIREIVFENNVCQKAGIFCECGSGFYMGSMAPKTVRIFIMNKDLDDWKPM
jgi:hypothetical protein